jgi:MOSC domain-containing protein YiiM
VGGADGGGPGGSEAAGRVVQINVSQGGVPKLPVPAARITRQGVEGDRQRDLRYHGGPERAVSVWSLEVIEALRAEGHPVVPGGAGENLTVSGLDWDAMRPGVRLRIGDAAAGVELEVTAFAAPCPIIRANFTAGSFDRISDKRHPGSSRVYCRVLREGRVAAGEGVSLRASGAGTGAPAPGCYDSPR